MNSLYNIIEDFCAKNEMTLSPEEEIYFKYLSDDFSCLKNTRYSVLSTDFKRYEYNLEDLEFFLAPTDFTHGYDMIYFEFLSEYIPNNFNNRMKRVSETTLSTPFIEGILMEQILGKSPFLRHLSEVLSYWITMSIFPEYYHEKPLPFEVKLEGTCAKIIDLMQDKNHIIEYLKLKNYILQDLVFEIVLGEQKELNRVLNKRK